MMKSKWEGRQHSIHVLAFTFTCLICIKWLCFFIIIRPRTYEFCIALSDMTYGLKDSLSLSASSSPYPKLKKIFLPVEINALVSAKYYKPVI